MTGDFDVIHVIADYDVSMDVCDIIGAKVECRTGYNVRTDSK